MSPINHKGDSTRQILHLIRMSKVERTQLSMSQRLLLLKPGVTATHIRLQVGANIWPMVWNA